VSDDVLQPHKGSSETRRGLGEPVDPAASTPQGFV